MSHLLDEIVRAQKRGEARGLPSICSAHPCVLETALRGESPVLIESTCNQVNQFGGYTGMTPADFVRFVRGIAAANGFPSEKLILGGDHLGPAPWQDSPMAHAMSRAAEMVRAYVRAGYSKLHLDASMKLGDDDLSRPLEPELVARRTAWLARVAEETARIPGSLRYVIGSEVPPPGGATGAQESVRVTPVEEAQRTLEVTRAAFKEAGLAAAWERVVALVVQPGVEFGDQMVHAYDRVAAAPLARFIEATPGLVYEAHSTDYQTPAALRALVEDHFAILKVGPALTFAFREAVLALAEIEKALIENERQSHILQVLEKAMLRDPRPWQGYYQGTPAQVAHKRLYSRSDRIRYYWAEPSVRSAFEQLVANLGGGIPLTLLVQHFPDLYPDPLAGEARDSVQQVIRKRIDTVLNTYRQACSL